MLQRPVIRNPSERLNTCPIQKLGGCLFDAVGGAAAVQEAVKRLYGHIIEDPSINYIFTGIDMSVLKQKQAGLPG